MPLVEDTHSPLGRNKIQMCSWTPCYFRCGAPVWIFWTGVFNTDMFEKSLNFLWTTTQVDQTAVCCVNHNQWNLFLGGVGGRGISWLSCCLCVSDEGQIASCRFRLRWQQVNELPAQVWTAGPAGLSLMTGNFQLSGKHPITIVTWTKGEVTLILLDQSLHLSYMAKNIKQHKAPLCLTFLQQIWIIKHHQNSS